MTVGFLGTGTIAAAAVTGLSLRQAPPKVHLSPRSESVSQVLAAKFQNVTRESSNADVVSKSQVVVLAMRPEQLKSALYGLHFRSDQTVVSFVATVPLTEIASLVSPATAVCRVTPLTFIERGRGPIVMYPALSPVKQLFEGLGDVLVADNESQMGAFGCAASVLSTFYELEHSVAQWLSSTGVKQPEASLYVRSMFASLANVALDSPGQPLMALAEGNETPGGLNERVRCALREFGMFEQINHELSALASLSLARPKET